MHGSEIGETRLGGAGDDEDPDEHPGRTCGDRNHIALDRRSEARRDRITTDAEQHRDQAEHGGDHRSTTCHEQLRPVKFATNDEADGAGGEKSALKGGDRRPWGGRGRPSDRQHQCTSRDRTQERADDEEVQWEPPALTDARERGRHGCGEEHCGLGQPTARLGVHVRHTTGIAAPLTTAEVLVVPVRLAHRCSSGRSLFF